MDGVTQRVTWEVAALCLAAHWFESAWLERIPDRVWDGLYEEGYLAQTTLAGTDEKIPFLTEKGQEYLRELLAADK